MSLKKKPARPVYRCIDLLDPRVKNQLAMLTVARSLVGIFDLFGLWILGLLLTSLSSPLSSKPTVIKFLPEMMRANWITSALLIIVLSFVLKSLFSIGISARVANLVAKEESRISYESAKSIVEGFNLSNISSSTLDISYGLVPSTSAAISRVVVALSNAASDIFTFIATLGFLLFLNPVIAIGAVAYLGLIGFVVGRLINKKSRSESDGYTKNTLMAMSDFETIISIQKEAFVFKLFDKYLKKFFEDKDNAARNLAKLNILGILPRYVMDIAVAFALLLFGLLALGTSDSNSMNFLAVLIAALMRLGPNLLSIQGYISAINSGIGESQRFFESVKPAVDKLAKQKLVKKQNLVEESNYTQVDSSVGFSIINVDFAYPASREFVFTNLNLEMTRTGSYAIIGPSGSGKTTLVDLLLGILQPLKGKILFSGGEVYSNNLRFSYVPQKPNLINATLRQNLTLDLDDKSFTDEKIFQALAFAGITHITSQLPNGLDTDLSAMSGQLSGGEIQRIGLARAILRDSEVYILDEYTSALDNELENELIEKVNLLSKSALVVIIAHRYSTLKYVDHVIDLGRNDIRIEKTETLNLRNLQNTSLD